jgi:hypothetical protein
MPAHSRSKNGVASLAYSRSKNGVASLAYSRSKNGVASLAYSRSKNGVASLAYVAGIHVLALLQKDVDGRDKPGHDGICLGDTERTLTSRETRTYLQRPLLDRPHHGCGGRPLVAVDSA